MRHKSRGFSGGRLCRPVLCCLPRTSRARRLAAENKGTISGITMRSGEYEDLVHGGIVKRTPAAIEGIGSKEAIFGALENVLGSLGGLDSARSWEFLLRTSRNHNAARSSPSGDVVAEVGEYTRNGDARL